MYLFPDEEVFFSQLLLKLLVSKTIHNHSFLKNVSKRSAIFYMIELMNCRIHWIRRNMNLFLFLYDEK
jgi:hypothetical protein